MWRMRACRSWVGPPRVHFSEGEEGLRSIGAGALIIRYSIFARIPDVFQELYLPGWKDEGGVKFVQKSANRRRTGRLGSGPPRVGNRFGGISPQLRRPFPAGRRSKGCNF